MADKSLQRAAETLLAYLSANAGNNPAYHDAAIYIRSLQAERDRLKAELERVRAALCDVTQTLRWQSFGECRGVSETLLSPKEASEKAMEALGKGGKADG